MTDITVDANSVVGTGALARLLGVTEERVRSLTNEGNLVQISDRRGKYKLVDNLHIYHRNLRAAAAGRTPGEEKETYKLMQEKAKAVKLTVEAQTAQDKVIPADEVEKRWAAIMRVTQSSLMALPSRIANRLNLDNNSKAVVAEEIEECLSDLADGGINTER